MVPESTFDGFSWTPSTTLEWRRPSARPFDPTTPLDGSDPTRMVFVFHAPCDFLPRELAALHATGMGLGEEWALAPYAIDDATDELWARRVEPRSLLWLAADNLNALYWGLHDWAHFHSHGPFVEIAATELQCDASALAWLAWNAETVGLDDATFDALCRFARALGEERCAAEGVSLDLDALSPRRVTALLPTPERVRLSAPGGAR